MRFFGSALITRSTASTWANWEAGKQPRNYLEVCQRISAATHVDLTWLLMGGADPDPTRKSRPIVAR